MKTTKLQYPGLTGEGTGQETSRARKRLYRSIWEMVQEIPQGRVATYGQIAEMCGIPGHARLVGYALHNLPRGSDVPWHRVINAQGRISLGEMDGMNEEQMRLLRKEGVQFIRDAVDFRRFGWMEMPEPSRRKR
ncbi:MAG TPA: methylated-DNA--[protein]-cysteine S-methyltransferase [Bacteroidota bacterium]|nr:methylated-DNA--[protein]-cysteine S-methyltransferase [Bacteroidota bacterium]